MKTWRIVWIGLALAFGMAQVAAVTPTQEEMAACRRWMDRLTAAGDSSAAPASIEFVYEDVADSMTRGRSWRGTPYQLGERVYTHGIAFNATKHLRVRLGRPAQRFTEDVGVENNDDTQRGEATGAGSVTFHVLVKGTEVFASPVMRRKDGPRALDIPLEGASEFEIRVKDGGDGRGWDQALWAEAVVALEDGSRVRVQDLPWADAAGTNPFAVSFVYGGTNSAGLLPQWPRAIEESSTRPRRLDRTIAWRDPVTGLEVRLEAALFGDWPAVEWVARLKNTGSSDTPILEAIQILDEVLPLSVSGQGKLHWAKGAVASFDDFAPQETVLKPGVKLRLQPGGGRSSSQVMPFFNVEGAGGGVVAAIGWSGEWGAEFACGARGQVAMRAGLAQSRLRLRPGEEIRTPSMALVFYAGERWRGQNLWRQFVLAHHRPRLDGKPLVAPITSGNWGGTRAEVHLDNIDKMIRHDLPVAYYWIDAEWYGTGGWPVNVGRWEVKRDLYPNGFKPLSDALRKGGRELMLWFEPERVFKGTPWHAQRGEWLLDVGGDNLLFNLGIPEARQFLTDFILTKVDEFGLGCYRQDFNMDPLPFWRKADAPDRQGLSEIRYIEGLYAFWDGLLAGRPGLMIDNCASGGRRIDLETLGRATPYWRSDGPRDPIAHQCHTYGLLAWAPLSATSQDRPGDDYEFRSSMCSALCLNWWHTGDAPAEKIPADFPFDWARATLVQYLGLRDFYYGDYYPLTTYSQARDQWMAYQLDGPELGRGLIVALRRPDSPYEGARIPLRAIDVEATYEITNLDTNEKTSIGGQVLAQQGIPVAIDRKPGSALLTYQRR